MASSACRPSSQEGKCFYCGARLNARSDVDHFLPWARVPNNNLENLVVAHSRCNAAKREFLPALHHVQRWGKRLVVEKPDYRTILDVATKQQWPADPGATLGTVRAIYGRLPSSAKLWLREKEFEERGIEELLVG